MGLVPFRGRPRTLVIGIGGVVVGLAAATGIAQAAGLTTALTDTVHACVSNRDGSVRIVAEGVGCAKNESSISWNQAGPEGPIGPTGTNGQDGRDGQQGPAGPAAPDPSPHAKAVGSLDITRGPGDVVTVPIYAYKSGAGMSTATSTGGSGAEAGKASLSPITVTKMVDATSPKEFQWLTTGTHLSRMVVHLDAVGDNPEETVTLSEVMLTDLQTENTGALNDQLHEDVSLVAGSVGLSVGKTAWNWNVGKAEGSTTIP